MAVARGSGSAHGLPDQASTVEKPEARAKRVTARQLDPTLPDIPIGEWFRKTAGVTSGDLSWVHSSCPATHEERGSNQAEWPVCVLVTTLLSPLNSPGQTIVKGRQVATLSIQLGHGNPNKGAWQTETPRLEDAFIDRDGDSVTVQRLRDFPGLLRLPPARWPKSDLSVSSEDVHCDKAQPKPGERVTCQAVIRNSGPVEAFASIFVGIATKGSDVGLGSTREIRRLPPNDRAVVSWEWTWPQGTAWVVLVSVEMHTPHGWGGYRTAIQDRDVRNNRASAVFGSW